MRRVFLKHGIRWLFGLLLTGVGWMVVQGDINSALIDRLDIFVYDARMRVQRGGLDPRIVIVDIDEKSIAEVGRWPWSRDVIAKLIEKFDDRYHARAVAFDVIFSEPDTSSGYRTLEALARNEFKDDERFRERLATLKPRFDYDQRMVAALSERPVVLGYFFSSGADTITKGLLPPAAFTTQHLKGREIEAAEYTSYTGTFEPLQRAAKGGGFMNPTPDSDGALRRYALLARYGDAYYESLALATARVALGGSLVRPVLFNADELGLSVKLAREYGALKAIKMNTKPETTVVPVERELTTLVNYRGPGGRDGGQFRYVSAVDVLKEKVPVDVIGGNIVLVGTTAAGLRDLRAAPVNPDYPGVEMHANVIASILDGKYKREPDFSIAVQLAQVTAVGIVLGVVLPLLSPLWSIIAVALVGGTLAGMNYWMFQQLDYVVPLAAALLLTAALFIFNLAWGYLFEYRKGRAMVNLFGEYVAPELVAEMAADPSSYSMEGESRELTVLFCDVRGFTTISEGLTPNELREYINLYLTAMSEDIRGNRGTLDKYIGDAVMAFWGAPVKLPDHASRAVASALQMLETAKRLNEEFTTRNWPPLKIGIGLNTGEMRVGDMGSRIRRAYTVMGDAVNLGSRLEGITKVYGVGLAVGDATRAAAREYVYRELDRVRVKGKTEPVPIFEPVALDSEVDDATHATLAQWHAALALVRAQDWDGAEREIRVLHEAEPERALYALYLERIAYYRKHPPGAEWDGVTTFETK